MHLHLPLQMSSLLKQGKIHCQAAWDMPVCYASKWKQTLAFPLKGLWRKYDCHLRKKYLWPKKDLCNKAHVEWIKKASEVGKVVFISFFRCFPTWRSIEVCLFCSSGWPLCRKNASSCFGSRSYSGKWYFGSVAVLFLEERLWRGAVKLRLSLGRSPVSPALWFLAPSK